jgi:ribose transport system permease protein
MDTDSKMTKTKVSTPSQRSRIVDLGKRLALVGAWVVIVIVFGIIEHSTFLSMGNLSTIFGSQAVLVILALSLLAPMTAGDYDLSVAANLTLASMIVGVLNVNHGWPIVAAIIVALFVGGIVGLINGLISILFRIDALIVTLGSGTLISGVVLWISNSDTISGISPGLVSIVVVDRWLGIPLEFYYGVGICALLWYVSEYTPVGSWLLFVGRGRNVARLSGLPITRVRLGALVASGVLSALGGVMYAGTTGSADPTSGLSFLLPAFAAVFLGSTCILPGRFNPWGTIIAVYFLITGITGLELLGATAFVQDLFYGGALIVAVALGQLARWKEVREEELTG